MRFCWHSGQPAIGLSSPGNPPLSPYVLSSFFFLPVPIPILYSFPLFQAPFPVPICSLLFSHSEKG